MYDTHKIDAEAKLGAKFGFEISSEVTRVDVQPGDPISTARVPMAYGRLSGCRGAPTRAWGVPPGFDTALGVLPPMGTLIRSLADVGRDDLETAGGKGANLGELIRAGFPVPPGFVVTTEAYRAGAITDALRAELAAAYAELGRPPVAVRSSATAEDLAEASFAGQQDTYLNVRGEDALVEAVQGCWDSLQNPRAIAYRERQGIDAASVSMAVVVQTMVEADAAGVMFTANPANGRRDQTVISAAWGLGEAVVSGAVDTDNLVVAKTDGHMITRSTADKAIMTGYAAAGTAEREVAPDLRREPVLDDQAATELTALGTRIEVHFGAPQDIEWARAAGEFFIVQSRPITALPLPEADPPTDWSVPDRTAMYVRASIVEQLPDPLTPLFADLIDGSVTRSLQALFTELIGESVIRDSDVDLPTINGYAYYRYSRSGMARLMLNSGGAFKFLLGGGQQGGVGRWRNYAHPRYRAVVDRWEAHDLDQLSTVELLDGVAELLDAGTEYYTSVQTIIPIAATSEVLFTQFYDRLVRRPGDPRRRSSCSASTASRSRPRSPCTTWARGRGRCPAWRMTCWRRRPSGWSRYCTIMTRLLIRQA